MTFKKENKNQKNNELLFGRFYANSNFVQERLLNVPTISYPSNLRNSLALIYRRPFSKNQSWDHHQFYWGILRLLGTYHFISWSSFLYWLLRYPCWWSHCHFFDLLELISLNRRASESTHELGHVLDLIITRNSDNFISGQRMSDILFSDNLTLLFKLKTAWPP